MSKITQAKEELAKTLIKKFNSLNLEDSEKDGVILSLVCDIVASTIYDYKEETIGKALDFMVERIRGRTSYMRKVGKERLEAKAQRGISRINIDKDFPKEKKVEIEKV